MKDATALACEMVLLPWPSPEKRASRHVGIRRSQLTINGLGKAMWYKTSIVTPPTKIPNFHDGYFDCIWIGPNKLVHCFLRTVKEQPFVLILEGVKALILTDLKQGNIILDLVFRSAREVTPTDIEELYGVAPGTPQVTTLLNAATEQGLQLLEINPSYGAQGLVLFQNCNLIQHQVQR